MSFSDLKNTTWRWLQNLSSIGRILLILLVYIAVGIALKEFADLFRSSTNVQPWDPTAGWNVLLIMCMGLRYAPAILVVAYLEDVIDIVIKNQQDNLVESTLEGLSVIILYSITVTLLKYKLDFNSDLQRRKDVFQFVVYWTVATCISAFSVYVILLCLGAASEPSQWLSNTMKEWAGQATGITILAIPGLILLRRFPWSDKLLTIHSEPPELDWSWLKNIRHRRTWLGFIVLALIFTTLAYGTVIKPQGLEYTYFAFIPLTFVAAWKGFEQASALILVINVIAVLLVYFQKGSNSNIDGTALQFGLMTLTYVGIFLGAVTTSHKNSDRKLRYDATHDSLTGLYNRAWLIERLQQSIESNNRFALLFLDLDRFKNINDSLGHTVGDRLLVEVAQRLIGRSAQAEELNLAPSSYLPPNKMVARLGGDEFVVLLEPIDDFEQVTLTAQAIIEQLAEVYTINIHEIYTSTSIGITKSESDYQRPEDILRDADIALYRAKARGKSQYAIFSSQMYQQALRRSQLETDLRRAVQQLNL